MLSKFLSVEIQASGAGASDAAGETEGRTEVKREIGDALAAQDYLNAHCRPYAAASIKSMLDR